MKILLLIFVINLTILISKNSKADLTPGISLSKGNPEVTTNTFFSFLSNYFNYNFNIVPEINSISNPGPVRATVNPSSVKKSTIERFPFQRFVQKFSKPFIQCFKEQPYRSYDGSCNNLNNPDWGMTGTPYVRLLPPIYSDGVWKPAVSSSGKPLPRARLISYQLFPQNNIQDPKWTLVNMQWGQIVTHDMAQLASASNFNLPSITCCDGNSQLQNVNNRQCFPITIGPNDPAYNYQTTECLQFDRTVTDIMVEGQSDTFNQPAEQMTMVTHFLDLSVMYGSSEETAMTLRSGVNGKLKIQLRNNKLWLPPASLLNMTSSCDFDSPNDVCYAAGDNRVNQNPQLTVLQTILWREHNRIADILARINPHWSDETIFQETRRITIGEYQHVTYYEWLPIILGQQNVQKYKIVYENNNQSYVDDYDSTINPSIINEHSNAAFRVFHSLIVGYIKSMTENRLTDNVMRLSDWYFKPKIIEQDDNFDGLTRGLSGQSEEQRNQFYNHEITMYLFRGKNNLGSDLKSIDIQRGRDHGLGSYNTYRQFCGLRQATTWEDFEDYISPENIQKLANLYQHPNDVDLVVGGSLEVNSEGSLTGPTFLCILVEQFYRSRIGDRFWFESSNPVTAFTREQLSEIRKASLARLFCDNSDEIENMQSKAFELPSSDNPIVSCNLLPQINLNLWKDYSPELSQQHLNNFGVLYNK